MHGGKSYLARRIMVRLPAHRIFIEPYAGGLNVLLNKLPGPVEVANDIDPNVMGLYRVLRDRPEDLLARLVPLPYAEEVFEWSLIPPEGDDPVEAAAKTLVRKRFSRDGLGKDFSWSVRPRGGQPGDKNAWETFLTRVYRRVACRLAGVELRCREALDVIAEFDGPHSLAYIDSPYLPSTRTAHEVYEYDQDEEYHVRLLKRIVRCRGAVAISGYPSELYDGALRGWRRYSWDMPSNAGQTPSKQRRIEVLWVKDPGRRRC
jgi:DNA adenine methylase